MTRQLWAKNKVHHLRPYGVKPLRESFLIFCEGETEVGYFGSFKKRAKLLPAGNALKIVQDAVAYKNSLEKRVDPYWVVFDKDDTPDDQFGQAVKLAQVNNIQVAWSNQAFECWIVLYYRDFKSHCHRKDYENILKQHIPEYEAREKGEPQGRRLHLKTAPLLATALANAKRGHTSFPPDLPDAQKQTSTLIYKLVEAILANG